MDGHMPFKERWDTWCLAFPSYHSFILFQVPLQEIVLELKLWSFFMKWSTIMLELNSSSCFHTIWSTIGTSATVLSSWATIKWPVGLPNTWKVSKALNKNNWKDGLEQFKLPFSPEFISTNWTPWFRWQNRTNMKFLRLLDSMFRDLLKLVDK